MRFSANAALLLAIAIGTTVTAPAAAATRSISYPIYATQMEGGAFMSQGLMVIPESGGPSFTFTIVMPDDYKNDSVVKVAFLYAGLPLGANSCTALVVPVRTFRARTGRELVSGGGGLGTGPANGDPTTPFPDRGVTRKVLHVTPIANYAKFPGLRKRDVVGITMGREYGDARDSCPRSVNLISISMEYQIDSAP